MTQGGYLVEDLVTVAASGWGSGLGLGLRLGLGLGLLGLRRGLIFHPSPAFPKCVPNWSRSLVTYDLLPFFFGSYLLRTGHPAIALGGRATRAGRRSGC